MSTRNQPAFPGERTAISLGKGAAQRAALPRILLLLGAAAGAVLLYFRAAPNVGDDFWALVLAVAIPVLGLGGIWLGIDGLRQRSDLRALSALAAGERPQSGAWVAIAGTAKPLGRTFEATLGGRPALACTYRVYEKVSETRLGSASSSTRVRRRYAGWHLVPMAIETSTMRIRLRGFPDLIDLELHVFGASRVGALAAVATEPPWLLKDAARAGLLAKPCDELHVDWKLGEPVPAGRLETKEWVLRPGEQICVCGHFENGALLPSRWRRRGLPLYPGSTGAVLEKLRGESRVYLRFGGIAVAAATGLGAAFLR